MNGKPFRSKQISVSLCQEMNLPKQEADLNIESKIPNILVTPLNVMEKMIPALKESNSPPSKSSGKKPKTKEDRPTPPPRKLPPTPSSNSDPTKVSPLSVKKSDTKNKPDIKNNAAQYVYSTDSGTVQAGTTNISGNNIRNNTSNSPNTDSRVQFSNSAIRERLYYTISELIPTGDVDKIISMILEMDNTKLLETINNKQLLIAKVKEVNTILRRAK